jgi:dCTP deaminase
MRLNDTEIKNLLKDSPTLIFPKPEDDCISGITCDVHLSNTFKKYQNELDKNIVIDPSNGTQIKMEEFKISPNDRFVIPSLGFALGCTEEKVDIPNNIVAWVDGKSSLARLGLLIHISAPRIDPGFKGQIVLEFFNSNPYAIKLTPGMQIGALSFEKLSQQCENPYNRKKNAKYKNQSGAQESKG